MKEVVIPILNNEYKVIVCWGDDKDVNSVLKRHGHGESECKWAPTDEGFTFTDAHPPIIALPDGPNTPERIGTLAHEAAHAVKNIFDHIGEKNAEEIYAHSIGAIVRETLKKAHK